MSKGRTASCTAFTRSNTVEAASENGRSNDGKEEPALEEEGLQALARHQEPRARYRPDPGGCLIDGPLRLVARVDMRTRVNSGLIDGLPGRMAMHAG